MRAILFWSVVIFWCVCSVLVARADQVYACADAGADGRVMSPWPNCTAASYQDASLALVVATNDSSPNPTWKAATKLTSADRVFSHDQNVWVANSTFTWAPLASVAGTGSLTLSWTAPTQNTDGSALTDLAGYWVYSGAAATSLSKLTQITNKAATSYVVTGLVPGSYSYAVTAYNAAGVESDLSATTTATVPKQTKPAAPTGLKTTLATATAYYIIQQADKFILLPVGTVPSGTTCDATQSVNGYYALDRSKVAWYGATKPLVVVGPCG